MKKINLSKKSIAFAKYIELVCDCQCNYNNNDYPNGSKIVYVKMQMKKLEAIENRAKIISDILSAICELKEEYSFDDNGDVVVDRENIKSIQLKFRTKSNGEKTLNFYDIDSFESIFWFIASWDDRHKEFIYDKLPKVLDSIVNRKHKSKKRR